MTILQFNGEQACQMAMLTNRVPEVNGGDGWKSANNQASARRFLQDNSANSVRLRLGDRVFLEDVLKQSIPVGTVLADFVASIDPSTLTSEQTQALAIFKEITT